MSEINEYVHVLQHLYGRSLILEDLSGFHPVMKFWYFDAMAHLDFSISMLAYSADSPRNILSREYLRTRVDEAGSGDNALFSGYMAWLQVTEPAEFEKFPLFIQKIYSPDDPAQYRSFRIILNPDETRPFPAQTFRIMIDELFDKTYLSAMYSGSRVCDLFEEYKASR